MKNHVILLGQTCALLLLAACVGDTQILDAIREKTPTRTPTRTPTAGLALTPISTAAPILRASSPSPETPILPGRTPTTTPVTQEPALTGSWQLDLFYQKSGADEMWTYTESLNGTARFEVSSDGKLSGQGSGNYTPGAKLKVPEFSCGSAPGVPITLKVKGKVEQAKAVRVFHMQVTVQFAQGLESEVRCEAPRIGWLIGPFEAPADYLTQRAARFPWSDFTIDTVLGIFSVPLTGEGLYVKPAGGGDVTIRVKRVK